MPPQQPYGLLDLLFQRLRFGAHGVLAFAVAGGGEPPKDSGRKLGMGGGDVKGLVGCAGGSV